MTAGSKEGLARLFTAYDNSHEPKPIFNYPSTVYGFVITFMLISTICVSLRIYTRIKLRCLGYDDLLVILFRISGTVGSVFICLSVQNGFGEHILSIDMEDIIKFQKKFYVALASYTISTTLVKLCLLVQYLRIFDRGSRERLLCWIGIVLSGLWGIAFSFCALAPCFPISGFFDWTKPAHCYGFGSKVPEEIAGTFAGHAASNMVLDVAILAMSIPLYFRTTEWKQRLGIGLLLLLGVIVALVSIFYLQTIIQHKAGTYPVLDPTWYGPRSIILAAVEVDLASICASIPTFWPIITHSLGRIFVTQEVHITHQHRRLSGDDQYELQSQMSQRSHGDSQTSLNAGQISTNSIRDKHYQDSYIMKSVVPVGLEEKEIEAESQVQSDGARGFKREQERLKLTAADGKEQKEGHEIAHKKSLKFQR
ncbi:hypothetical protein F5B20DRAFT_524823 [Whalleya microplaca]|nr:hypothetical protein F5B20DRAFT_524823 [Whalleya microplaca]